MNTEPNKTLTAFFARDGVASMLLTEVAVEGDRLHYTDLATGATGYYDARSKERYVSEEGLSSVGDQLYYTFSPASVAPVSQALAALNLVPQSWRSLHSSDLLGVFGDLLDSYRPAFTATQPSGVHGFDKPPLVFLRKQDGDFLFLDQCKVLATGCLGFVVANGGWAGSYDPLTGTVFVQAKDRSLKAEGLYYIVNPENHEDHFSFAEEHRQRWLRVSSGPSLRELDVTLKATTVFSEEVKEVAF